MARHLAFLLALALSARAAAADAFLYGGNPGVDLELATLPRASTVETFVYKGRRLAAVVSGWLAKQDLLPIFQATFPDEWLKGLPSIWHLTIRGNDRFARLTVDYWRCGPFQSWLLSKQGADWVVIDEPLAYPCFDFGSIPVEVTQASPE